jgi:hypothetical protein
MASSPLLAWPLSDDVAQRWATFLKSLSQVGLVNIINETKAGDPDLERKIVTEGFGYGQQLGRIVDVLEVLIRHTKDLGLEEVLKPEERKSFDQFADMAAKIDEMKVGQLSLSEDGLDAFLRRMEILRDRDSKVYKAVRKQLDRLHERLKAEDG